MGESFIYAMKEDIVGTKRIIDKQLFGTPDNYFTVCCSWYRALTLLQIQKDLHRIP